MSTAALLATACLVASSVGADAATAVPATPAGVSGHACNSQISPTANSRISCTWLTTLPANVGQSAPTVATLGGTRAVIVGDVHGHRDALSLSSGAALPGWNDVATGAERIDAPASTDGSSRVYMGLSAFNGHSELAAYSANGHSVWGANTCHASHCQQSPGLTLTHGNVFTGGMQQYVYGIASANGSRRWAYLNSDSTNSTAATASLTGSGPLLVFANDQTGNSITHAVAGGHLRVFTPGGTPICDANIGGPRVVQGSFSSSPAIGTFGGGPEIVVGTGDSGVAPHRVLFYNSACQLVHKSPALAGVTFDSPAIADLNGSGVPKVVEEVRTSSRATVVYVLSGLTGKVLASRTLTGLVGMYTGKTCGGAARGTAASSATLDVNGDGAQDIIAPAGSCGAIVLDGRSMKEIGQVGAGCLIQNAPLVTGGTGSAGITIAGYRAKAGGGGEGCVFHYVVRGGIASSTKGWPEFHHDPQLTGSQSYAFTRHGMLLTGQSLPAGHYLFSTDGAWKAGTNAKTGRLEIIHTTSGHVAWSNGHPSAGARLVVGGGSVVTKNTRGVSIWSSSRHTATRPLSLIMQDNGVLALRVHSGNEFASDVTLWHS